MTAGATGTPGSATLEKENAPMRVPVAALVLLATLSACALPRTPAYLSSRYDAAPLRAHLMQGVGSTISFHVNRPAHVAVFEIDPVYGVQMIHPNVGLETFTMRSGVHSAWRSWRASSPLQGGWGGSASFAGWGHGRTHQPRVYLLIASERPLHVDTRMRTWHGMRMMMSSSFGFNTFGTANELTRLVVPSYELQDYVTDILVEWPQAATPGMEPVPTHVLVCRDGRQILAPVWVFSCPQDSVPAPPLSADTTVVAEEGRPQRPDRRRPERAGPPETPRLGDGWLGGDRPDGVVRPERTGRPERAGREERDPSVQPAGGRSEGDARRPERPVRPERSGADRGEGTRAPRPESRPESRPAVERTEPVRAAPPPRAEPTPRAEPSPRSEPPPRSEPTPRAEPAPRPEPAARVEPARVEPSAR
jgi:hypothetical protein